MNEDRSNLFVYGTLKKGGNLHSVLGNSSEFLGVCSTEESNWDMYDYGCPIMVTKYEGFKIKGELYSVTPECMARVTAVECGAGYVPFMIDTYDVDYSKLMKKKSRKNKAIAFIYPTPYTTTMVSNHVKENKGIKEWIK